RQGLLFFVFLLSSSNSSSWASSNTFSPAGRRIDGGRESQITSLDKVTKPILRTSVLTVVGKSMLAKGYGVVIHTPELPRALFLCPFSAVRGSDEFSALCARDTLEHFLDGLEIDACSHRKHCTQHWFILIDEHDHYTSC
ncbi:hypothetical protein BDB00DRAFT_829794, partial [Zychaea mexicana]|uniref:uncharacterized protein n=1 Tax=Zychaea mexicana TaxID=64656 RepID=UPI0022FE2500